jgi:dihydrofolate reductase
MCKVFFSVGISLDGFIAGLNGGPKNPLGDGGTKIHQWVYPLKSFREHLMLEGGETGNKDDEIVEETFKRTGASVMGRRMFNEGEANWPENAPFRTPVYVVTTQTREPWVRQGGTTFYFVNDGIQKALEKAKRAAGNKDVRIAGGADVIQQFINAGLVDEFRIHVAPILLGKGVRLFDRIEKEKFSLEIIEAVDSPHVTHLQYKVLR